MVFFFKAGALLREKEREGSELSNEIILLLPISLFFTLVPLRIRLYKSVGEGYVYINSVVLHLPSFLL